jgi:cold shock protein
VEEMQKDDEGGRVGGKVKFFSRAKGWGMVTRFPNDDGGGDYFVHHASIMIEGYRELWDGELVTFIPCVGSKGRYADEVIPTSRVLKES